MRNIKFRIWSYIDKTFTYFDVYTYPQGISGAVSEPQQFTGVKDKNGNEIYEGDIITGEVSLGKDLHGDSIKYTGVVEFCKKLGHFGVKIENKDKNIKTSEIPAPFGYFLNKDGNVIIEKTGTIHENG